MLEYGEIDQVSQVDQIPKLRHSIGEWISGRAWSLFKDKEGLSEKADTTRSCLSLDEIAAYMAESEELHKAIVGSIYDQGDDDAAPAIEYELLALEVALLRRERDNLRQRLVE